jgi:hypothetical protein
MSDCLMPEEKSAGATGAPGSSGSQTGIKITNPRGVALKPILLKQGVK